VVYLAFVHIAAVSIFVPRVSLQPDPERPGRRFTTLPATAVDEVTEWKLRAVRCQRFKESGQP
jgi:hypothetical protein